MFLEPQSDVTISLDAAQVAFIEFDKLVLSLKGGELYVLTLCADSMRSVRSFHFSKAASSVLTSCVSLLFSICLEPGCLSVAFYSTNAFVVISSGNNLFRRISVPGLTTR